MEEEGTRISERMNADEDREIEIKIVATCPVSSITALIRVLPR
jgi:hypothetical protein